MQYSDIWDEERNNIIQKFVDSEPIVQEIKDKLVEYDNLVDEVQNLPQQHIIGPIEINMGCRFNCSTLRNLTLRCTNVLIDKISSR